MCCYTCSPWTLAQDGLSRERSPAAVSWHRDFYEPPLVVLLVPHLADGSAKAALFWPSASPSMASEVAVPPDALPKDGGSICRHRRPCSPMVSNRKRTDHRSRSHSDVPHSPCTASPRQSLSDTAHQRTTKANLSGVCCTLAFQLPLANRPVPLLCSGWSNLGLATAVAFCRQLGGTLDAFSEEEPWTLATRYQ